MLSSDLRTIGQVGSTLCIGLLLDTLIVRSFVVPCILRTLGPWFWWPTLVRTRPLPAGMLSALDGVKTFAPRLPWCPC
jgi:putative drug exporter of the RND superfamily